MKVAELVATFPPHHGGMGYVCFHNALELSKRGHEVTVFTLDHGRPDYGEDQHPFKIERLKSSIISGDAGIVPQLISRLRDFDIIHLHYPFFGGAEYVWLASVLRGKKYFLTYHMDVSSTSFLKKAILNTYDLIFTRPIIAKAAGIGALTRAHLESSKIGSLVDWSKVVDMPNGVDVEIFSPGDKASRLVEQYGLQNKVVVLFVGNLQPFKGIPLLIKAIAEIDDSQVVLLIVGGGYDESSIRTQVNSLGIEDRVIFAGPQSPSGDLPAHYRLGDFLVLPSTYSESFGLVVLEAMASGIPAIVSSLPGPSQLVNEGKDGLVARVGDVEDLRLKIEFLVRRPDLRKEMGQHARNKVVANYSWHRIGEHLESVLVTLAH